MQLARYNPFHELQEMERNLDRLWDSGWAMPPSLMEAAAMDLYEEDGNLVAEVSLPNFKKDEVKITTEEGVLEVSAEHKEEEKSKDKRHYFFRESSSRYFRRVSLPQGVKADKADASFKDGVLKVKMPMAVQKQAKEVAIK